MKDRIIMYPKQAYLMSMPSVECRDCKNIVPVSTDGSGALSAPHDCLGEEVA